MSASTFFAFASSVTTVIAGKVCAPEEAPSDAAGPDEAVSEEAAPDEAGSEDAMPDEPGPEAATEEAGPLAATDEAAALDTADEAALDGAALELGAAELLDVAAAEDEEVVDGAAALSFPQLASTRHNARPAPMAAALAGHGLLSRLVIPIDSSGVLTEAVPGSLMSAFDDAWIAAFPVELVGGAPNGTLTADQPPAAGSHPFESTPCRVHTVSSPPKPLGERTTLAN